MKLTTIPQLARNVNRVRAIITILSKYGLADWISRLDLELFKGLFKASTGPNLVELTQATRIRLALSELGTTFIKFGQVMSTRGDLVGPELARELSQLQEGAPADPVEKVRAVIESELGKPVAELFAEFEEKPLASGSIGQVHRARLKDGRLVAVKVQHPSIETRIRTDLEILVGLAELVEEYLPDVRRYRPRALAAEFQRLLLRELDFGREGRHLQQFANNFARDPNVRFPTVFAELSTSRVLTMEYLDGVKIAEAQRLAAMGVDREELARRGAIMYLDMIFRDGFYHADPHPGNLLALPGGVIAMLDCGMVGRLDERLREQIEEMLLAIAAGDGVHLTSLITRIGSVPPELDQAGLNIDVVDFLSYYASQALDQLDLGGALTELTDIIRRYQIVLPTEVALLIKVLIMLEGTSRLLNPHFNLMELIKPYQQKLVWRRLSPARHLQRMRRVYREIEYLGEVLPRGLADILQQVQTGRFDVHLEHRRLEPSVNRLVLGMLTSSLFLGSALLASHHVEPLVGGVSLLGALGCAVSVLLGLRLLWAIRKSGHLDRR
jgi:ubiquinone biosynthesis protein